MAQYLLSVHHAGSGPDLTEAEMNQSFADVDACNRELMDSGSFVFAGGLLPTASATTVRQSGGEILVTDGPYLETKEHLGGFWVIEVADLDAALAWAKKATVACRLPVEVRPFQGMPEAGMPEA
jgi:hypothetical protein